jgi:hypothetical protein
MTAPAVVELRNYRLHPGRRDELIELFEREFVEPQESLGIELLGLFRDADRSDAFVWLRGFPGMDERRQSLEAFYGGPIWREHREAANATMLDSDDVLLLRPSNAVDLFAPAPFRGPLLCVTKLFATAAELHDFAKGFNHAGVFATFVSEDAANTFPRLPVREGENAFVFLTSGVERAAFSESDRFDVMELVPTTRSRVQLAFAGKQGDFDFLTRMRTVTHRKLRERLRGCTEWDVATGAYRGYSLANGSVSVDECDLFTPGARGCSIRNLDVHGQRWSIHWTTSASGRLFPPVRGGFNGVRGEFYGTDVEDGTPVLARYVWTRSDSQPRWEQAFSTDGGRRWETNWIMEFSAE